jgi:hypothetical protein
MKSLYPENAMVPNPPLFFSVYLSSRQNMSSLQSISVVWVVLAPWPPSTTSNRVAMAHKITPGLLVIIASQYFLKNHKTINHPSRPPHKHKASKNHHLHRKKRTLLLWMKPAL